MNNEVKYEGIIEENIVNDNNNEGNHKKDKLEIFLKILAILQLVIIVLSVAVLFIPSFTNRSTVNHCIFAECKSCEEIEETGKRVCTGCTYFNEHNEEVETANGGTCTYSK